MSDDPVIRIAVAPAEAPAKRKPPALGRGLGALMGETRREESVVAARSVGAAPAAPTSGPMTTSSWCSATTRGWPATSA